MIGGGAVLAVGLAVAWARGRVVLHPPRFVAVAAGAFALALVWATLASPHPLRSVTGIPGRWSGLALYAACLVIAAGAASLRAPASSRVLRDAVWLAAVPVLIYGLAQWQGVDPLGWRATTSGPAIFATLANRNFLSGWGAVIAVLAAASAVDWGGGVSPGRAAVRRLGGAAVAVLAALVVVVTTSQQGLVALAAGGTVLLAVWLTTVGTPLHRHAGVLGRLLAGAGALVALVVAWGLGPAQALQRDLLRSLEIRLGKWEAALRMAAERPWAGVGLDLFADGYHQHRPLWEALERGVHPTADAAHSVPLQLLAGGGIPLGLAWVAVVAAVGVVAHRGLRRLALVDPAQRLLLGGFVAAWVAVLVQGLVSIDVPPLATLHALLAGAIVAVGVAVGARGAEARAEAGVVPAPGRPRRALGVVVAVAALGLAAGLTAAAVPIAGAERAERRAVELSRELRTSEAAEWGERARAWAPWEPRYALADARRHLRRGDVAGAVAGYEAALRAQPSSLVAAVELARLHSREGDLAAAEAAYERAIGIDPQAPQLRVEAARVAAAAGDLGAAVAHLEAALAADSAVRGWWEELAVAREVAGDDAGAAQARTAAAAAVGTPPEDGLRVDPPAALP